LAPGLPTNRASSRFLILHARKLICVPRDMDPAVAASFTIGPQTSYGILRRLELQRNSRVLVTAAHSNTSLFVLEALRRRGVEVFATASSRRHATSLTKLGVKKLFLLPRNGSENDYEVIKTFSDHHGGFDAVIDPFFDLHLLRLVGHIRPSGKYITCGVYRQHTAMTPMDSVPANALAVVVDRAIENNISVIGNCLGTTEDLRRAIRDYSRHEFELKIDSVFKPEQMVRFFQRSFDNKKRFGKVVMLYE